MTKQLIRDALPRLIEIDTNAMAEIEKFVSRKLRSEQDEESGGRITFLAHILVAPSIQKQIIEDYIDNLTAGSLQSPEELARISSSLGLSEEISIDHKRLKPVFKVRNKIIHELDINLDAPRRNRNVRNKETMIQYANVLLQTAEKILISVNKKLR